MFDSFVLFISLAVGVVQTSVVVIERKAKKQMMAIINKLMWMACIMISIAFFSLSFVVVGDKEKALAIGIIKISLSQCNGGRSYRRHGHGSVLSCLSV